MNYSDPRVGWMAAGGTTAAGSAKWIEMIPNEIGKIATLIGAILSLVLIVVHLRKMRQDAQAADLARIKAELEIAELRARIEKPHQ